MTLTTQTTSISPDPPNAGALNAALASIRRHLLPFLFLLYGVADLDLDRVNVSFVAADVSRDLGLTSAAYGFASGIFFLGYGLFEIPCNLILEAIVLSAVVWFRLPNRLHQASWMKPSEVEAIDQTLIQDLQRRDGGGRVVHGLGALFVDRRLWLLSVLSLGIATSFDGFRFWIPKFVADAVPRSLSAAATL